MESLITTLRAPSITCLGPRSKRCEPKKVSMYHKHTAETPLPLLCQQKSTYILSGHYEVVWDYELWPWTATVFLTWAFSDREMRQFLKVAFQMICAGVTRIRHRGLEERVRAVWHQFSSGFHTVSWRSRLTSQAADEAQRSKRLSRRGSAGKNSQGKQKSGEKQKPNNTLKGVMKRWGGCILIHRLKMKWNPAWRWLALPKFGSVRFRPPFVRTWTWTSYKISEPELCVRFGFEPSELCNFFKSYFSIFFCVQTLWNTCPISTNKVFMQSRGTKGHKQRLISYVDIIQQSTTSARARKPPKIWPSATQAKDC